jgi:short-subunit dehydrogenase
VTGRRLITVERVAEVGYEAMMRGKPYVIPGAGSKFLAFAVRFLPRRFVAKFVHRMQEDRV